jgi:hypothetical protein
MRHILENRLRIVVLDSFYDCRDNFFAREFFPKIMQLKLKGYLAEYPHGTLPIDSTDFLCTHYTICIEEKSELRPIMAFKSIGSDRCRHFNVTFPAITILGNCGETPLKRQIQLMLLDAEQKGSSIHYGSSWTIDPEIRNDRELTKLLRDYFIATNTLHFEMIAPIELMACGILRFKTEQFLGSLGYCPVDLRGSGDANFFHAFLNQEPSIMVHATEVSDEAKLIAESFREAWKKRIVIDRRVDEFVRKVA